MSIPSYELTRLDSNSFEHLINGLAMSVLGAGLTGFGPGSDGGRDGYFEGKAPYPSPSEQWTGRWYIQSKFHPPHLSADSQKWLLSQIQAEINAYSSPRSRREVPDIWIVATNIEPSGVPETGCFDAARRLVRKFSPTLAERFHIWGGRKVLDLLAVNPSIAEYYGQFLTPGHVLKRLYDDLGDSKADVKEILNYLTKTQLIEQQFTKLEQAGSSVDNRPGIQQLFVDIPFASGLHRSYAARTLAKAVAQTHRPRTLDIDNSKWLTWNRAPERARVWFVKGGPGQGKSTLTQYMAQIHRAAIFLEEQGFSALQKHVDLALDIKSHSTRHGLWPQVARVPVTIELKDFAFWFGERSTSQSTRIVSYLAERLSKHLGQSVLAGTLKRAFSVSRWLFIFDGLDEVPSDVKDRVADEVVHFVDDYLVGCLSDAMVVCTSRPQGYSGQFSSMGATTIELISLTGDQALKCATPLLKIARSESDSKTFLEILKNALKSPAISEILKTPLQAHIMAVIVRDGGRPPERRWKLFNTFYEVIKKREANRDLPDRNLATLLRGGDKLLRSIHNRLGFELHARAEKSAGATTSLDRENLSKVVTETVSKLQDKAVKSTVATVMLATTERLVLVNTPESGEHVRFDIRPLQEFFAAEFMYRDAALGSFAHRIQSIAADAHWREVMHFLISALVENGRVNELAVATQVLGEIDASNSSAVRVFRRRLARGSRIAGRLLAEGVLEEDKQVRLPFLNAIAPIAAQTNPPDELNKFLQPHSLDWLRDALMISIREQAVPETIGAAIILGRILHDRDKRSKQVRDHIWNSGRDYVGYFLHETAVTFEERGSRISRWVAELAVDYLSQAEWYMLPEATLYAASMLVASRPDVVRQRLRLPPGLDCAEIICAFLSVEAKDPNGSETKNLKLFGAMSIQFERFNSFLTFNDWSDNVWKALENQPGLFGMVFHLFAMLHEPSDEKLDVLIAAIGNQISNLDKLPFPARNFLRDVISFGPTDKPRAGDIIQSLHPGWSRYVTGVSDKENVDWKAFAKALPSMQMFFVNEDKNIVDQLVTDPVDGTIFGNSFMSSSSIYITDFWHLLSKNPQLKGMYHSLLIEKTAEPVRRSRFRRTFHAEVLDLPTETPLLPHIVSVMLDAVDTESRAAYLHTPHTRFSLPEWISSMVKNPMQLANIIHDRGLANRIRVAAFIMHQLHPKRRRNEDPKMLIELYDARESTWMLPGIAYSFFDEILKEEGEAFETFGALLEMSQTDYFGRASLESPVQAWRETSRYPVSEDVGIDWLK